MNLEQIIALQKEFDQQHESDFKWDQHINKDNLDMLEYLALSLAGEAGEVANAVKKVIRGDLPYDEQRKEIELELTDVFIYLIKFAYQMDFDLSARFIEKMEINRKRFKDKEYE
jgi:NTP pyrophosphatase (non-canonical NTP hydrolase)